MDEIGERSSASRTAGRWRRALAGAGVEPALLLRAGRGLPRFLRDEAAFRRSWRPGLMCPPITNRLPMLGDATGDAGTIDAHYFVQDLLVARRIRDAAPGRHVDVGSRIDGFVAHLLTFMDVEVVDVRPLKTPVAGLTFVQDDGTTLASVPDASVPSLSSLHAVEHFGLGRYGDPIDPGGAAEALRTFARVLAPGGTLYLSFPIGRPRVEFNAHRIFDPRDPIEVLGDLDLVRFSAVDDGGDLRDPCQPADLLGADYALGIYEFVRRP